MTNRAQLDWTVLDIYDGDPVPGDPTVLEGWKIKLDGTLTSLDNAITGIAALTDTNGKNKSEALLKAMEQAGEVKSDLEKVKTRYKGASEAMIDYPSKLREAQTESLDARTAAATAKQNVKTHQAAMEQANQQAHDDDPAISKQGAADVKTERGKRDAAQGELDAAKKKLVDAVAKRNEAAQAAERKINDANRNSKLNDNFMDKLLANPVFKWVWDHLGDIATVLDFLSWVCTFVPGLQGVAAVLKVLATVFKILDALKQVLTVFTAIQDIANGKGGWGTLIVALGGVLMSAGSMKELGGLKAAKNIGKQGGRLNQTMQKVSKFGEGAEKWAKSNSPAAWLRNKIAGNSKNPILKAGKDGGTFSDFLKNKFGDRISKDAGFTGKLRNQLVRVRDGGGSMAIDYTLAAKAKNVPYYKMIGRDMVTKVPNTTAAVYNMFSSPSVNDINIPKTAAKLVSGDLGGAGKNIVDGQLKTYLD